MGQKINPNGMRVGIYRDWESHWFANDKDYSAFLLQDIKIREFLEKNSEVKKATLSHIEIDRKKNDTNGVNITISLFVAFPAIIIGQAGDNVNKLNVALMKHLKLSKKDDKIRLTVEAVKNPDLDAMLVAKSIAKQLEERASFRIAQKKAIQRVRRAGAAGIKTLVSGRLGGADIARSEGYKEGVVPLHTLRKDIDYAHCEAHTTYGRLGVKVWICRGDYDLKKAEEE